MNNKNISFNHTLEEYNKKYRNRNHRLVKYTKKEVEEFDKKYPSKIKNYLLKDRKWWLIGDTYYEIPIAPRATWFRNLNTGVQVATCAVLGGAIVSAVVVPTVIALNKPTSEDEKEPEPASRDVSIDTSSSAHVTCSSKVVDKNLEITLKVEDGYEITGISDIKINGQKLTESEYTFKENKIVIKKEVLDKYSGKIVITPTVDQIITFKSFRIDSLPNRWVYAVNDTVSKPGGKNTLDVTGLKVIGIKADSSEVDITDKIKVEYDLDHEFTKDDISEEKEIKITYRDKAAGSFNIAIHDEFSEYFEISSNVLSLKSDITLPKHLLIPAKLNDGDIKYIKQDAFKSHSETASIDMSLATNLLKISDGAFKDCTGLKKIKLNEGLTDIGDSLGAVFENCSSLEEITIPSSVNNIVPNIKNQTPCFYGCKNLKTVIINSTKYAQQARNNNDFSIYNYATNIYVKEDIDIGTSSFLSEASTVGTSTKTGYKKYDPVELVYKPIGTNPETYEVYSGITGKDKIEIPATYNDGKVTKVGARAFQCSGIEEVVLPDNIASIGGNAFFNCYNLRKINIPSQVQVNGIGGGAFQKCSSLNTVAISSQDVLNSQSSPSNLFNNANTIIADIGLTDPTSPSYIADNFNKDTEVITGSNVWLARGLFSFTVSGTTCSIKPNGEVTYKDKDFYFPSTDGESHNVVKIGVAAFYGYEANSFVFSKNITEIDTVGLASSKFKKIVLNEGLTTIGDSAFSNASIDEMTIPSTLKPDKIASGSYPSFSGATIKNLIIDGQDMTSSTSDPGKLFSSTTTIYIKNGLTPPAAGTYIGDNFAKQDTSDRPGYDKYECKQFSYTVLTESPNKTCSINASNSFNLKDLIIPDEIDGYTVTKTEDDSFRKEKGIIKSVSLPTHLEKIGDGSFKSQSKVTSIVFNNELKVIGGQAFAFTGLTGKITLNDGLTEIGGCAFANTNIEEINMPSSINVAFSKEAPQFDACNSLKTVVVDSKTIACSTDDAGKLFNNSGRVIKILNSIVDDPDFANGYLKQHSTQGTPKDGYTPFTIN